MLKLTIVFHHLPIVSPQQLCALGHLECTVKPILPNIYYFDPPFLLLGACMIQAFLLVVTCSEATRQCPQRFEAVINGLDGQL